MNDTQPPTAARAAFPRDSSSATRAAIHSVSTSYTETINRAVSGSTNGASAIDERSTGVPIDVAAITPGKEPYPSSRRLPIRYTKPDWMIQENIPLKMIRAADTTGIPSMTSGVMSMAHTSATTIAPSATPSDATTM